MSILNIVDKFDVYSRGKNVVSGNNSVSFKENDIIQNEIKIPEKDEIREVVDKLNSYRDSFHERVSFAYHEKTNRIIVKVHDLKTDEIVREIPSKNAIKLLEQIQDHLGLIFDASR